MKGDRRALAAFLSLGTQPSARPWWLRYGVAVGSVALGWVGREAFTLAGGPTALPFLPFFPAIAMAAWYGGLGPGLFATGLSAVTANYFFLGPGQTFAIRTPHDAAALAAFTIECLLIIGAMEMIHRARRRLVREVEERQRLEAELAHSRAILTATLTGIGDGSGQTEAEGRRTFLNIEAAKAEPPVIAKLFVLASCVLVGSAIFLYSLRQAAAANQRRIASLRLSVLHLGNFISTLKDAETGQRGYLLTGDDQFLEPYGRALAEIKAGQETLRRLASAGELPSPAVENAVRLSEEKLAELNRTLQSRRENGLETALAVVRGGAGKATMDEIRAAMAGMAATQETKIEGMVRRAQSAETTLFTSFLLAILINLAFLTWAYRRIASEVRARGAAALETSRQAELLATTLASIGDGVIVTDASGHVTFLNSEAQRLTGWKSADAAGQPLADVFRIVNEYTRRPGEDPVEKVLRLGNPVGLANHTLLLGKDGTETPIDDSAAPIREHGGPLFGVVLVFRDVSGQRKAEEARARLAAIVEFSGDAILSKSLEGTIRTWNAGAQRLFGYAPDEVIGKPISLLLPPDHLHEEEQIVERLRRGQPSEWMETFRLAKNGQRIPVALSVSPLKDQDNLVVGASTIIHDITDALAAREALAREKELLATTLASIGDAVIVTDALGRVRFLNGEAERLTGWKNSEAQTQSLPTVFRIINEHTRQPAENPVEKVLRLGQVVGLANHTLLLAKDGKEIPIDDSAAPIRQPSGRLFGVVLVFRDFTEQRNAQQELIRSKEDLERLVSERTLELREMVNELQHVSYAIAHDLRAPLRAMSGFAELLAQSSSVRASDEDLDYCQRILTGASRLDALIRDALNYSKAVLQQPALVSVDLGNLLRGLLDTYPNFHPGQTDIRIEGSIPFVLGNESLLTQCFSNLLGNAVKFIPPGGRPRVRIRAEARADHVRIWVEDNGIGIPARAQKRLFGLFQKLDDQYGGTGVGLAIVRKVVERMGGKVGVESEPGKGSRFWVDLRLAEDNLPQKI